MGKEKLNFDRYLYELSKPDSDTKFHHDALFLISFTPNNFVLFHFRIIPLSFSEEK